MATLIQVSDEVWEKLNKMKKKGESFNDVLVKLVDAFAKSKGEQESPDEDLNVADAGEGASGKKQHPSPEQKFRK